MGCGCGLVSFGKKSKRRMRMSRRMHISRRMHVPRILSILHSRNSRKNKKNRKSKKPKFVKFMNDTTRSDKKMRYFGSVSGPGYRGATSFPNSYAPYFGAKESFVNASQWWYPVTNGQFQSPQMLYRSFGSKKLGTKKKYKSRRSNYYDPNEFAKNRTNSFKQLSEELNKVPPKHTPYHVTPSSPYRRLKTKRHFFGL